MDKRVTYESPVMEYISLEMLTSVLLDASGNGTETYSEGTLDSFSSGSY